MTKVDLNFQLMGTQIPADHGYYLYSAMTKLLPDIHSNVEIGIHPINGVLAGNRLLNITPSSSLTVRLPSEHMRQVIPLAGKTLRIGEEHEVRTGVPNTRALIPAAKLYSRLVVIKGFLEPQSFLEAANRQLALINIKGTASLIKQEFFEYNNDRKSGSHSPFLRRTVRIKDKEVVGFALMINDLTDEDSIVLQEQGLGGRRRFGCGIFVPVRG